MSLLHWINSKVNRLQESTSKRLKSVEDFQKTVEGANIDAQEKVTVSGYEDIINLPKNAATGQAGVGLKGLTATNIVKNGNFVDGISKWSAGNASLSAVNNTLVVTGSGAANQVFAFQNTKNIAVENEKVFLKAFGVRVTNENCLKIALRIDGTISGASTIFEITNPVANQWYPISHLVTLGSNIVGNIQLRMYHEYVDSDTANGKIMEVQKVFAVNIGINGDLYSLSKDQLNANFPYWFDGTKSALGAMRVKSVGPYTGSALCATAKDAEGKIMTLKGLPNGVVDEIACSKGRLIQRIRSKTLQDSDIVAVVTTHTNVDIVQISKNTDDINYNNAEDALDNAQRVMFPEYTPSTFSDSVDSIGRIYNSSKTTYGLIVGKDTYTFFSAKAAFTEVTYHYQLAVPVIESIQTVGSLFSYPSGTIYVDPVLGDIDFYGDGIIIPGLEFSRIEKVTKVDLQAGTEEDVTSTCTLNEDKNGFTSTALETNDLCWYELKIAPEITTNGEKSITYYDSRYAVVDSEDSKIYRWKIVSANGVPSIVLEEIV